MKKALQVASVASMIDQFTMPNINILQELGYEVDVAANFEFGSTSSKERVEEFQKELKVLDVNVFNLLFNRKIFDKSNIQVYKQLKKVIDENNYEVIHCHSPIGGVITRLAARKARKKGTKVIYTAHGFHFFKGAPLINWLVYYPVEWVCSWLTDVLITINKEDYLLAQKRMRAKEVCYVPGVGVDTEKFKNIQVDPKAKKRELGLPEEAIMLLSVGELNKNKNHQVILRSMAMIGNQDIHYCIAGKGNQEETLIQLAKENKIENRVHLLGFRTDVGELYKTADIFCFPSYREGLSVALMEAMSAGLPCVVSKIRGNTDLITQGNGGGICIVTEPVEFKDAIERQEDNNTRQQLGRYNMGVIKKFDINCIKQRMITIYNKEI